ncbi:Receptor-like serine/threonine-protein kinase [Heracleum sosnowskyi]|uniref:Receptor-like serine/threonine-protein kinase n=1 Tax=Heracleum sosnowskyi TaxID=360622 RepID=A0AAD8JHS1_9APIA|nr:Receptor-like serine/threonine-protein kinase [Heracleum sosnowskyi]
MKGTIILFFFLFTFLVTCNALDNINTNQPLRDGETIVSEHGEFEMGFFSTRVLPQNRYFGIWYKKISNGTVVWVANRDHPVTNTSGVVTVTSKGIVVLADETILWSSNSSTSVNDPLAQLLDSGNLIFRDKKDGTENIVWQSFDHPVNNFLPGMKLGIDFVTGMQRYLSSWKSADDPSSGNFVYRYDPNGYPQVDLWGGSNLSYRTGPWVGDRYSGIPKIQNEIYTVQYVISEKEIYYKFKVTNTSESAIVRSMLTPEGVLKRLIWNKQNQQWTEYLSLPVNDCDSYRLCGENGVCNINNAPKCECMQWFHPNFQKAWSAADWSGGCARKTQLNCENGDGFVKVSGVKLPDTRLSWYNLNLHLRECKRRCLNDCSCMAYSNIDDRGGGSGCLLWFGDLIDMRYTEDGQDLYIRMAASELDEDKRSSTNRVIVIVLPVLAAMTVILVLLLLYAFRKRKLERTRTMRLGPNGHASEGINKDELDLPLFTFMQIAEATNGFSFSNKLGEGGFGPVYKGMLDKGQEIAVKRLSKTSRQGVDEFMNEVSSIAKLQHRNLVKLLGCCVEEEERMLIYENMPNRGLDSVIFDKSADKDLSKSFDWKKRYNIIKGIARGLLYLHQDSRLRIIHRDLKVSNILLDCEMNPKISDFGMARIFGGSETQASTTRVVGTYGYMSPEYAIEGIFSTKSDVYSFGVVVLEIVSGKRNRSFEHPDHNHNLLGHVWTSYKKGNHLGVVDSVIRESYNQYEVFRVIQIALLCVQQYPEDRPSMASVVLMLSSKIELAIPKEPGFYSERNPRQIHPSSSNRESETFNQLSITSLAPR